MHHCQLSWCLKKSNPFQFELFRGAAGELYIFQETTEEYKIRKKEQYVEQK